MKNKLMAEDTVKCINQGFYEFNETRISLKESIDYTNSNTLLVKPDDFHSLKLPASEFNTEITVRNETSVYACLQLSASWPEVLCLNFASAKNPGGGFLGGAEAQEESLARVSTLYASLLKAPEFYAYHRAHKTLLYSNHMVYSPKVAVFKTEHGETLEKPNLITFITSAATNAGALKNNEQESLSKIESVMHERIRKVLLLAASKGHRHLILGAWGCGVFANDPKMIARLFHHHIQHEFKGVFEKIHFAVLSKNGLVIEPFLKYFGNLKSE